MITFSWDLGHLQGPFLDILVCLLVLLGFCPGDHFGHLLVCEYFSLHFVRGICGFILWSHFADLFCGLDCVASSWGLVLFCGLYFVVSFCARNFVTSATIK